MKYNDNGEWKDIQVKVANAIQNEYGESNNDGYSQNYLNDKVVNVGTEVDSRNRVNLLKSNNLFDKNNATIMNLYPSTSSTLQNNMYKSVLIQIKPNTTYTFTSLNAYTDGISLGTYTGVPSTSLAPTNRVGVETSINHGTITSGANDKYLLGYVKWASSLSTQELAGIMINEGSEALPYEPYVVPSIYVDNEEIYSKEYVLYNNPAGTNANLTLNDNPYNFNYVEIFYKNSWLSGSVRINMNDDIGTKSIAMTIPYGTSTNLISIHSSVASITTSAINFDANRDRDVAIGAESTTVATTRQIKITKVIGYK